MGCGHPQEQTQAGREPGQQLMCRRQWPPPVHAWLLVAVVDSSTAVVGSGRVVAVKQEARPEQEASAAVARILMAPPSWRHNAGIT